MSLFLSVLSGLAAGIISGMGIGGGTILIPALSIFLRIDQHVAQGVNLLYFIPTAIIALIVHIKNKSINYKLALPIVLLGIAGAVGGSALALVIHASVLRKLFGGFLFLMGIYEICKKNPQKQKK